MEMENQSSRAATSFGASSSSTAADPNNVRHDAFINHRGEVKKTIADHLYRKLLSRGLRPFLDQEELRPGSDFPSQIKATIRSAAVHVAIFSPGYAGSEWCLNELLLMLDSGAPIIPIFYNVTPAELKWTDHTKKGVYAEALKELQTKTTIDPQTEQKKPRYDSDTIQNWRNALSKVAYKTGFDLQGMFNGDEDQMLHRLVERVVEIVNKNRPWHVAKYPTGLDEKVTEFETAVLRQQYSGKVLVMGIVGLGGAGKTTLALEIYNREKSKYNFFYFFRDVREYVNKKSLHSLQEEILNGLTQSNIYINNINEGIAKLKWYLESSHVLLILDDIDHEDQLEAILPIKDVLSSDSLILITSRNKDVLLRSEVDKLCIYNLKGLNPQHSLELFCQHAFHQVYPLKGYKDLVDKFLNVCEGLPLSLKVLGALLFGREDKSEWEDILHQCPIDIQKKLKISYDALSREEQQIFLDIACFCIGEIKNSAITLWDGSGWSGSLAFKNLEDRCLVEVDSKNVIHMHDHLRDMGREIAKDEWPRRFWRPIENIDDLLHQHSSVKTAVRGIRILRTEGGTSSQMLSRYQKRSYKRLPKGVMKHRLHNTCSHFYGMNLQILDTEAHMLERIVKSVKLPDLIWLSLHDCPYSYMPSWIPKEKLRILKVKHGSALKGLWKGVSEAPLELRHLEIIFADNLSNIPESFGNLTYLQYMYLYDCASLKRLPDSFGNLAELKRMFLHECVKLKSLPDSFGNLVNLQHMRLTGCRALERLPDSFGNLAELKHMFLHECDKLKSLPDSFGNLVNLQDMCLTDCYALERLPDSFGNLVNLQHINLSGCMKLERLPDSFGNLVNLQQIDLRFCEKLERLPDSFGNLVNLQQIDLSWCEKLERLPDSLGNLITLQEISLYQCQKLEGLPVSFGRLNSLKSFTASGCSNLTKSSDTLGNIRTLEHIDLSGCEKVEVWPWPLGLQSSLKTLKLTDTNFKELLGAVEMPGGLEVLWIEGPLVDRLLPSLGDLRNLKELTLKDCRELKHLPASVGLLTQLTSLTVIGCPAMELPFKMVKGKRETVGAVKSDSSIHKYLSGLQRLTLDRDTEISEVSFDEDVCPNLQDFDLYKCSNLARVGTLPGTLTGVRLIHCSNLRNIDGLCGMAKLQILEIYRCEELQELPSLKTLSLNYLSASDCVKLRSIRGLAQLPRLRILDVNRCVEMEELEGVESCTWLENIFHQNCTKLRLHVGNICHCLQCLFWRDPRSAISSLSAFRAMEGREVGSTAWLEFD